MICASYRTQNCETCQAATCSCGHKKSTVRPLTTAERHEYMLGRRTKHLVLRQNTTANGTSGQ